MHKVKWQGVEGQNDEKEHYRRVYPTLALRSYTIRQGIQAVHVAPARRLVRAPRAAPAPPAPAVPAATRAPVPRASRAVPAAAAAPAAQDGHDAIPDRDEDLQWGGRQ